jgi:dinuclear metal center YbgI/SA1388 family protein
VPADLARIVAWLDDLLQTASVPDYGGAVNGLQFANSGQVTRVAAAVDFSRATIRGAIDVGAELLIVHHGMFWGGAMPVVGAAYERFRDLVRHDVAVYASHLPLDRHPELGNNVLLARELDLQPSGEFARYKGVAIGLTGEADLPTADLVDRASAFARRHGGALRTTPVAVGRRTRRWALCTGAGASSESIREAVSLGADTLIVGEGPHHTAIDAAEHDVAILYCGHYATETLGVRALAERAARELGLEWTFVESPTGL